MYICAQFIRCDQIAVCKDYTIIPFFASTVREGPFSHSLTNFALNFNMFTSVFREIISHSFSLYFYYEIESYFLMSCECSCVFYPVFYWGFLSYRFIEGSYILRHTVRKASPTPKQ